jgi:hypothetical protein
MSISRFSGSQRRTAIIATVIVVLVVGGLLLPPISVLERTGIVCAGTTLNGTPRHNHIRWPDRGTR